MTKIEAPRIYNLFPRLAGTVDKWPDHLERILKMNFNWLYLNPLNYNGFSGSLYAIKDFYKFNPLFAPKYNEDPYSWEPLKEFITKCHDQGLRIMYDLVINHTSVDSSLVEEHEEWYLKKWAVVQKSNNKVIMQCPEDEPPNKRHFSQKAYDIEKRVAHPCAIDPADSRKVTIWGDLAEIDNENSSDNEALLQYWLDLVEFYLELGIDGFRCDAAYQVPPETWKPIITHAKRINPRVIFVAETLGCTLDQFTKTVESGFDYIFSSSKWWDFTEGWLLEQYEKFRDFAPSISFPESHDTVRLAKETGKREDVQEVRYLFSAFFSAGVMMPIGYEFGFLKKLDVVKTRPSHWEKELFDITTFIKKTNEFKSNLACMNEDGPITHFNYENKSVLIMKKEARNGAQQLVLIYNKDWHRSHDIEMKDMKHYLGNEEPIYILSLDGERKLLEGESFSKSLSANEYVFLFQELKPNQELNPADEDDWKEIMETQPERVMEIILSFFNR